MKTKDIKVKQTNKQINGNKKNKNPQIFEHTKQNKQHQWRRQLG